MKMAATMLTRNISYLVDLLKFPRKEVLIVSAANVGIVGLQENYCQYGQPAEIYGIPSGSEIPVLG